jgi:hypothetical protein
MPTTAPPALGIADGRIVATCPTAGASIAWTADPHGALEEPSFLGQVAGDPQMEGRVWHLYTGPFAPPDGATLWFRAQRLGYRASEDVSLTGGEQAKCKREHKTFNQPPIVSSGCWSS